MCKNNEIYVIVEQGVQRNSCYNRRTDKDKCRGCFGLNDAYHQRNLFSYRVFCKYCVFPRIFHYFGTSPSPTLGWYWLYRKWQANKSDCTLRSDELISYMQGMGCRELGKNTIFIAHPVGFESQYKVLIDLFQYKLLVKKRV